MNIPTTEEYTKAKEEKDFLIRCRTSSMNRLMSLVEDIRKEKENLDIYNQSLEEHEKIIIHYEAYQEVVQKQKV